MSFYQVVNPATGTVESEFPTATDAEVSAAVGRSAAAFPGWRDTPVKERAAVITRVAQLYDDRADQLAAIITREMGKTTAEALGEIEFVGEIYRYYADQGPTLLADEPLDSSSDGAAFVRKAPIGPLLGIMPWNYPYYQVARFAGPNLVARQHDPAQARPAVPRVRARDGAALPRRRAPHRRVHQPLRQQRAGRRHHRRPAGPRASR